MPTARLSASRIAHGATYAQSPARPRPPACTMRSPAARALYRPAEHVTGLTQVYGVYHARMRMRDKDVRRWRHRQKYNTGWPQKDVLAVAYAAAACSCTFFQQITDSSDDHMYHVQNKIRAKIKIWRARCCTKECTHQDLYLMYHVLFCTMYDFVQDEDGRNE